MNKGYTHLDLNISKVKRILRYGLCLDSRGDSISLVGHEEEDTSDKVTISIAPCHLETGCANWQDIPDFRIYKLQATQTLDLYAPSNNVTSSCRQTGILYPILTEVQNLIYHAELEQVIERAEVFPSMTYLI